MSLYDRVAELPLVVDDYRLEPLALDVAGGFHRMTTVVRLRGAGHEGVGEDVTYEEEDQALFQEHGAVHAVSGAATFGAFSELLDVLDFFPRRPRGASSRYYRRWAFESAALDLALRQAERSLADLLEREARPVRFVVSLGLGDPPDAGLIATRRARYAAIELKLDPTPAWDDAVVRTIRETGAPVRCLDLKGHYVGTPVDGVADPDLYRRVVEAFPEALMEDPVLTPETEAVLRPHRDRVSWDAPLHSVADIQALPFEPRQVNVKPSRFGTVEALLDVYGFCEERSMACYGGGQFELGPGRGQIQYLASLFHPDAPNDVAPTGYNDPALPEGLPASPLASPAGDAGFRLVD